VKSALVCVLALAAFGAIGATAANDRAGGGVVAFLRNERVYVVNADGSGKRRTSLLGLPFYSPDRKRMAFFSSSSHGTRAVRLYAARADGSARREILRLTPYDTCANPEWSPDGKTIAYTTDCDVDFSRLHLVKYDGTAQRLLLPKTWALDPAWAPNGSTILFTAMPPANRHHWRLFLIGSGGGKAHRIGGTYPDPDWFSRGAEWSRDGKKIFFLSYSALRVMNRDGSDVRNLTPGNMTMGEFDLSPDGRMLVVHGATGGAREIYVLNTDGSGLRQLTNNRAHDMSPRWSPDGRKIVFTSKRDGNSEIYVMNADGTDQRNLSNSPAEDYLAVWLVGRPPN
jgi:Tol biopolymer transport system component